MHHLIVPLIGFLCVYSAWGAEYFVSLDGDDSRDGLTQSSAFTTIQRGIDALAPGDTLTILPGHYHEAVARQGLGSEEATTTIRAAIPGTVLLRGDEPAPSFEPTPGFRFVYQANLERVPQAVNELDSRAILEPSPTLTELEYVPGRFFYEESTGTVYISTTDFQPATSHIYSLSTIRARGGIFLREPVQVVIEGLSFTGFSSVGDLGRLHGGGPQDRHAWGLYLSHPRHCVVRHCVAWLNAGGIGIQTTWGTGPGNGNTVEYSMGYDNGHTGQGGSGNIHIFNPSQDQVLHSRAFDRNRALTNGPGIRTHSSSQLPGVLFAHNLSWGHTAADFQIKSYGAELQRQHTLITHCAAPDSIITARVIRHTLSRRPPYEEPHPSNIYLDDHPDLNPDEEFADPLNHDYRLQASSRFRGAGPDGMDAGPFPYQPNLYFLRPDGDDKADGHSLRQAWKSLAHALVQLQPGDTLYLASGSYRAPPSIFLNGSAEKPIRLLGRGEDLVVIEGTSTLRDSTHIEVERLIFADPQRVEQGDAIRFHGCRFLARQTGLSAKGVTGLRLEHAQFSGFHDVGLQLEQCQDVIVVGSAFDNRRAPAIATDSDTALLYCDQNVYSTSLLRRQSGIRILDLGEDQPRDDRYSRIMELPLVEQGGVPVLQQTPPLVGLGPQGFPYGPYREHVDLVPPLQVIGLRLHTATATTANLEWWATARQPLTVRWGTTPETDHSETLEPIFPYHPHGVHLDHFTTFSLTDLQPETRYYVRIEKDGELLGSYDFMTAAQPHPPRDLYVSPTGHNQADGLTPQTAWRTIGHAASQALPGDTVWIGEGVYQEKVRVRATGRDGAPITFRSRPGEKVVMDGADHSLETAFSIWKKQHIQVDGIYFRNFKRIWTRGLFNIVRSEHITLTRCFADGRGAEGPELVTAGGVKHLTIRNCVMLWGWGGIAIGGAEHVDFSHNVVVRPSISPIGLGATGEGLVVSHNIITDNLAKKHTVELAPYRPQVTVRDNCFHLRKPEAERPVFGVRGGSLADYDHAKGNAMGNRVADPLFLGDPTPGESFSGDELTRAGVPVDFYSFFATNPQVVAAEMGLQPEAFADFHFNRDGQGVEQQLMDVVHITTSHAESRVPGMVDGDPVSRWDTAAFQEPGMWVDIRFTIQRPVREVLLRGGAKGPQVVALYLDRGHGLADQPAAVATPEEGNIRFTLADAPVLKGLRIVLQEANPSEWWVLHELTIDGRSPILFRP